MTNGERVHHSSLPPAISLLRCYSRDFSSVPVRCRAALEYNRSDQRHPASDADRVPLVFWGGGRGLSFRASEFSCRNHADASERNFVSLPSTTRLTDRRAIRRHNELC